MSSSKDKSFFSLYITSKDGLETAALVLVFDIRIPDQHWLLGPECKSSSGSYTLYLQFLTKIEKKKTTKRTTGTAYLKGLEKPKVTFDAQTNVTAVSQTENP